MKQTATGWLCLDIPACLDAIQAAIPADCLPPLEDHRGI
jgi:hypothetical protein